MRAAVADYLSHLQALLPPGAAWPREPDAVLTRVLAAEATGLTRAHNRALDLLDEADPRTTVELLAEWERLCGLPDACTAGAALTLAERRAAVVGRLTARGGQSRRYFVGLAAATGYPGATVTEFPAFRVGSPCTAALHGEAWRHVWRLNVPDDGGLRRFTTGTACTDALRAWGRPVLECAVRRVQPAHGLLRFGYGAMPAALPPPPPIPSLLSTRAGAPLAARGGAVLIAKE